MGEIVVLLYSGKKALQQGIRTLKNSYQDDSHLQKNAEDEGEIRRHPRKAIRLRYHSVFKETVHPVV